MSKLDWKSGGNPRAGWYLVKDRHQADHESTPQWFSSIASGYGWDQWIGPLDLPTLPEKAPEPPAPDWGRGPVPAYGDYLVYVPERTPTLRSCLKGSMPRGGALDQDRDWWYGPIPDRPAAEEPAEANEWSGLAGCKRCGVRVGCIFVAGHLGRCHLASGERA